MKPVNPAAPDQSHPAQPWSQHELGNLSRLPEPDGLYAGPSNFSDLYMEDGRARGLTDPAATHTRAAANRNIELSRQHLGNNEHSPYGSSLAAAALILNAFSGIRRRRQ